MHFKRASALHLLLVIITVSLLIFGARPFIVRSSADRLQDRQLQLQSALQGDTTLYKFNFKLVSATALGSIRFQFCSDTPLIDQPCQAPDGFNGSGSSLVSEYGVSGFTKMLATQDNEIVITRTSAPAVPGAVSFSFKDVINPSATGSYYVRIMTYASEDGTGPYTDFGGLSYVINDRISISSEVPPYLLICSGVEISGYDCDTANGNYINFGELSSSAPKAATSQLVLATNADNGYGLYVSGATMASNADVIQAIMNNDVSRPGTTQFGINLAANTSPAIGQFVTGPGIGTVNPTYAISDRYHFTAGEELASADYASDYNKYTISYLININKDQPAGIYVSTLSYIAIANF